MSNKREPSMSRAAIMKRNKKKLKTLVSSSGRIRPIPPNFLEEMPSTSGTQDYDHNQTLCGQEDGVFDFPTDFDCDNDNYYRTIDVDSVVDASNELSEKVCNDGAIEEMVIVEDECGGVIDNDHNCHNDDNNDIEVDDDDDDDDDYSEEEQEEEDDDDDDDNDNPFFSVSKVQCFKIPLLSNKNISMNDHFLSIVATALKHHMSYEAMLDIFRWIKASHTASHLPTTKAALWEILCRNKSMITQHYYCKLCDGYLGPKNKKNKLRLMCPCKACGPKESEKYLGYFINLSLISQIRQLLKIPNIAQALKYRFRREKRNNEAFEDIYDGLEYQRLCLPGKFLEEWSNFSMTFNTDGCQISKSTKTSAWPVYVQINELPPHMRKKYVLLAAIYVGDKHPKMNNLLRPFTLQMKQLFTKGITWNPTPTTEVTSRFVVVASTLDAPARAAVLRMKQYNGYFSCVHCYAKGKRNGRRLVYPYKQSYLKLRTDKELKADMEYVTKTRVIRNGVKGYSSLTNLPLFSITKGVIVETMHSVFLGAIQLHTTILIKSTGAPYYIGKQETLNVINETLLSIRPPSRRSRKPRKIQSYAQWKASEWRNWLDYAPICLSSVLDIKYVNHLSLLSEAIHYLNSDSLTLAELNRADSLLKEYAKLFEEYFGEVKMTSNIHSLSHVVECIRNWGPMWVHNAFNFESWNMKIAYFVTSPVGQEDQISTRFLMQRFINYTAFDSLISNETRNFIMKKLKVIDETSTVELRNKFVVQKGNKARSLSAEENQALIDAGYTPERVLSYESMQLNGVKFSLLDENKITKFSDSFIYNDSDGIFSVIKAIVQFHSDNKLITGIIVNNFKRINYGFNTGHIHIIKPQKTLNFIEETRMIRPAIKIETEKVTYGIKLANSWETD